MQKRHVRKNTSIYCLITKSDHRGIFLACVYEDGGWVYHSNFSIVVRVNSR